MFIIFFNEIVILIPSAIYLNILVSSGIFTNTFYIIQRFELVAEAINIVLMFKNIQDSKNNIIFNFIYLQ